MVENVGEDGLDFRAEALIDVDALFDLEVDVPERHAAKYPGAAHARVDTQDGGANAVKYRFGVGELVHVASSADSAGARNAVVA